MTTTATTATSTTTATTATSTTTATATAREETGKSSYHGYGNDPRGHLPPIDYWTHTLDYQRHGHRQFT